MIDLVSEIFEAGRVPVFSLAVGLCAERRGLSPALMHDDPQRSFDLQLEMRRAFGFDSPPFYLHATYGTWEHAAGLGFPSSELRAEPTLPYYPVSREADLTGLALPEIPAAGMLPRAMRFSELQRKHELPVSVVLAGVFTMAANICGMENLFGWMIESPALVQRLLQLSREHLLAVARHWTECFGPARVTPILWEGMATHRMISPRQFEQFVLPQQRALHSEILELGVRGLLCHICGEQGPQLGLWSQIPMGTPGIVSLGSEVDLERAGSLFPESILMGNLDPRLLREASPQTVRERALRCLELGRPHAAGFILAPGCDLQLDVPAANLAALVEAAGHTHS